MDVQENMESLEPGSSSLSELIKEEILGGADSVEADSVEVLPTDTPMVTELVPQAATLEMNDTLKEESMVRCMFFVGCSVSLY